MAFSSPYRPSAFTSSVEKVTFGNNKNSTTEGNVDKSRIYMINSYTFIQILSRSRHTQKKRINDMEVGYEATFTRQHSKTTANIHSAMRKRRTVELHMR